MTRYYTNYEEVEYTLGYTFTPDQREMIATYIFTGQRPVANGCWSCNEGYIRKITGEMDQFENKVDSGEAVWPWPMKDGAVEEFD